MVAYRRLVEEHIKTHNELAGTQFKVVRGRAEFCERADDAPKAARYIDEGKFRAPLNEQDPFRQFITNNISVDKKVLVSVGGFDEDFKYASAEDYDLCRKVVDKGSRILYEPSIEVIHQHSQTVDGIIRRAFTHGTEIVKYRRKRGGSILYEVLRIPLKFLLTPYFTLTRYQLEMMPLGLVYELCSLAGNVNGILRYWRV
jgi:GT2 family glycosyltransferase